MTSESASNKSEGITVGVVPLSSDQITQTQSKWLDLEARSDRPFFLSWMWIGVWLSTIEDEPLLCQFYRGERLVGLGFLVSKMQTRHGILKSRQYYLNATGNPNIDSITIEYNSFLTETGEEGNVWQAFADYLNVANELAWDEIIIPGLTSHLATSISGLGTPTLLRSKAGSYFLDLDAHRLRHGSSLEEFVATLGKNTRSQIRRSLKLYKERGDILYERADSPAAAWAFLQECAPFHAKRWEAKGGTGAFDRAHYSAFHKSLIDEYFDSGELEVIRISAGDQAFAWLYNFIDKGRLYFYLCAFRFEQDNRLKPGLVAHSLCITEHLKLDTGIYDFMGGDNRYKSSLGEAGPDIQTIAIQRSCLKFKIEGLLRRLKNKLLRSE